MSISFGPDCKSRVQGSTFEIGARLLCESRIAGLELKLLFDTMLRPVVQDGELYPPWGDTSMRSSQTNEDADKQMVVAAAAKRLATA